MKLLPGFYQIGGSQLSHSFDASIYLVDTGRGLLLLDCGAPEGFEAAEANIRRLGLDPRGVRSILGTHGHYDHLGAAAAWKEFARCSLCLHEGDRRAVETGDGELTSAALLYGRPFPPAAVDVFLLDEQRFEYPNCTIEVIHTPGHTPGSVCFVLYIAGLVVLVGGDTLWGGFSEKIASHEGDWRRSLEKIRRRHYDLLTFGHTGPVLYGDADERIGEMIRQFAVYYNPWFKPMGERFRY